MSVKNTNVVYWINWHKFILLKSNVTQSLGSHLLPRKKMYPIFCCFIDLYVYIVLQILRLICCLESSKSVHIWKYPNSNNHQKFLLLQVLYRSCHLWWDYIAPNTQINYHKPKQILSRYWVLDQSIFWVTIGLNQRWDANCSQYKRAT
jgi:hypothetical protein